MSFNQGDLTYESSVWAPVGSGSTKAWTPVTMNGSVGSYWGWEGLSNSGSSYISYYMQYTPHSAINTVTFQQWNFSNFVYYDQAGAHFFSLSGVYIYNGNGVCGPPTGDQGSTTTGTTSDGTYLTIHLAYGAGIRYCISNYKERGNHFPACSQQPIWTAGFF